LFRIENTKTGSRLKETQRKTMSDEPQKALTLQELPEVRRRTEGIAQLLHDQLTHHLDVLWPLLAPERLLGKATGAKIDVPGADMALADLQRRYKEFVPKPFELPSELDSQWLTLIGNRLKLHQWDYIHLANSDREPKPITMTSPVRWILSYGSNYTVAQAKAVLSGKESRRVEYIRQFVVNALVMNQVIAKNPGLVHLFADLRYEIKMDFSPELGRLPLVTITSCLPSFRPADDLIIAATGFSGVPAFIELLDLGAVRNLQDPLKQRIEAMLQ